jgi:dienelactone hydrolase
MAGRTLAGLIGVLVLTGPAAAQGGLEAHYRMLRPEGAGPLPAVMLVSGCGGLNAPRLQNGEDLKKQGYVVIFVDYLGARNIRSACGGEVRVTQIAQDILDSAAWLKKQPGVDPARVAALGWSLGGGSIIAALGRLSADQPALAAAVTFYPYCRESRAWKARVPLLLLLAGRDDVTPPEHCLEVVKQLPAGSPVEVHNYPEARHTFDMPTLPAVARFPGRGERTVGYHPESSKQAWAEVAKFLETHLRR